MAQASLREAIVKPTTSRYTVREDGRNGNVIVEHNGIVREIKKSFGKTDRQFIPYASIGYVEHNRKTLGSDIVTVHVGAKKFEWKVGTDAEGFVDTVNGKLALR